MNKGRQVKKRIAEDRVMAMHADHMAGMTMLQVARKYKRATASLRQLFERRGLEWRRSTTRVPAKLANGRTAPLVPLTKAEIAAVIASTETMQVPAAIRQHWRHWTLAQRADFVRRVRAKLPPDDLPKGPYSANVTPFDYGSAAAHAIARELNHGRDSRTKAVQIRFGSQGVIWEGRLWFWTHETGYLNGQWSPAGPREMLHHVIWSRKHGRPVPKGMVLRFADGNANNLVPENLVLAERNTLCRENQAKALQRKSREHLGLLLDDSTSDDTTLQSLIQ